MEAKLAWYGPRRGFGSEIREAKALRADIPEEVRHGAPLPDSSHPMFSSALLMTFAAGCVWSVEVLLESTGTGHPHPVSASAYFSPHSFLRPPPAS
jgi:hypothetical protein